jgi:hypothetical protein
MPSPDPKPAGKYLLLDTGSVKYVALHLQTGFTSNRSEATVFKGSHDLSEDRRYNWMKTLRVEPFDKFPKLALASEFTLPVYLTGDYTADPESGTFTVEIGGREYLTEGIIGVELEHKLVWCQSYETVVYGVEAGRPQADKPKETYHSDYENSEEEAIFSAERWQEECLRETGLIFPILRRV